MTLNQILSQGQREAFEECVRVLEYVQTWLKEPHTTAEGTADAQANLLDCVSTAIKCAKPYVRRWNDHT